MADVSALFWDVGGVLLSNGWDRDGRSAAALRFRLDAEELERRHDRVSDDFETGRLDLAGYLATTVFDEPRSFSQGEFIEFMRSRSHPHEAAIACARSLRAGGRYVMATLNNESWDLNNFRIATFRLREIFPCFFSSCYTGRRKPDSDAYRFALQVTQRAPDEALLLDDRRENLDAAARLGLRTLWVQDPARVREELAAVGIVAG